MELIELFLILWAGVAAFITVGGWKRNTPIGRVLMPLTWPYAIALVIMGAIMIALLYVILASLDGLLWISVRDYQPKILKKKSGWKA